VGGWVGVWEKSESKNYIPFGDVVKKGLGTRERERKLPDQVTNDSVTKCWDLLKVYNILIKTGKIP
jgi:hypothetical protein